MNPRDEHNNSDPDSGKGAVESFRPEDNSDSNVAAFERQLDHRFQNSLNKSSDSGMPEMGQTAEFSMEARGKDELKTDEANPDRPRDSDADAEAETQDQDPGERQRRNHNDQKDDPLAA